MSGEKVVYKALAFIPGDGDGQGSKSEIVCLSANGCGKICRFIMPNKHESEISGRCLEKMPSAKKQELFIQML